MAYGIVFYYLGNRDDMGEALAVYNELLVTLKETDFNKKTLIYNNCYCCRQ